MVEAPAPKHATRKLALPNLGPTWCYRERQVGALTNRQHALAGVGPGSDMGAAIEQSRGTLSTRTTGRYTRAAAANPGLPRAPLESSVQCPLGEPRTLAVLVNLGLVRP